MDGLQMDYNTIDMPTKVQQQKMTSLDGCIRSKHIEIMNKEEKNHFSSNGNGYYVVDKY